MDISLSELSEVKGIGKTTIERVKQYKNYKENLKQERNIDLQVDKLETNIIHNKDNIKGMRQLIPDNSIDLTVTSPPYDDLRDYEGYDFDYKPIAKQLYRVTKEGGIVVWVVGDKTENGSETLNSFKQALYFKEEIGFNVHDTMIYKKTGLPFPPTNRYYQHFEYMFVFSKGKPKTFNPIKVNKTNRTIERLKNSLPAGFRQKDGTIKKKQLGNKKNNNNKRIASNIRQYCNVGTHGFSDNDVAREHPARFPDELAKEHIKTWSNEGDIVLDPFMGSGTTAKMANKLNRKYIGFEVSEKYCKIAKERLKGGDK